VLEPEPRMGDQKIDNHEARVDPSGMQALWRLRSTRAQKAGTDSAS